MELKLPPHTMDKLRVKCQAQRVFIKEKDE